jgi:hypothetical protein
MPPAPVLIAALLIETAAYPAFSSEARLEVPIILIPVTALNAVAAVAAPATVVVG